MSGRGRGKRIAAITTVAENKIIVEKEKEKEKEKDKEKEKGAKKVSKKKQFPVIAIVGPDGIEGNLLPEQKRPLIVHLRIQSKDVPMNDMPIAYDPAPPNDAQPYDINADDPFYEGVEQFDNQIITPQDLLKPSKLEITKLDQPIINIPIIATNVNTCANTCANTSATNTTVTTASEIDYYNLKSTLLIQYKDSAEVKTIPQTSDVACFWCCHVFTNRPVVLPMRDTGEHLQVTGNFCSPECACSYLFDMRQDSHTRWEQLALLYRVYGEACQGKIQPAPARNTLKLFGGGLSISEYRGLIQSHKVRIDIHLPPMVSILATMDTKPIDFYDSSLTKGASETIKERLQKAEEVLRLRRTKPLKAWESTLDACINLRIKA
jgi:hypothetical protein